ncbi:MAG: M48 family metalloprotease [Alphaproteobacteria bacterium]|nr:M48 family metalloprotease [Alphaproteobacteria bacterium]MBF0251111.1 M48 family metalloprotease [Alphaproteobacteria bacterium]
MLAPCESSAAGRTIIRDAEIENIIREFTTPIFQAADLNPQAVRIRLIQDKTLNAFVAGGQNIFIHTGLIVQSRDPGALIGVIAHETGHIEGGHLTRTRDAIEDAKMLQTITTILGAAVAVGSGRGDAGQAVMIGGQSAGLRSFLQYSQTQESAADQAAMRLLDATERSASGLEGFLSQLGDQEVLSARFQDPYAQTHPLSRDRLDALRDHIRRSPHSVRESTPAELAAHQRMVAKLYAYGEPFAHVMRKYPETDTSFAARYARAIAHYRKPDLDAALNALAPMIAENPNDPYLWELKGQMLFEHGRGVEALEAYRKANSYAPREPLILLELARVELETNDPALLDHAIEHLNACHRMDGGSSFSWNQLGIAYGRKGDIGMSSLAMAESEFRGGSLSNATYHVGRAVETLPAGSSAQLKAQDLQEVIKSERERREREKNK